MTAAAGEIPGEVAADEAVFEAPAVLRIFWADPQHMDEHIALWPLTHLGPRAGAAVAKLRSQHPDAGRDELERLVIGQQARTAMTEGAFVGGPFIALIPVAFCASLLAQAQMVFDLAALGGPWVGAGITLISVSALAMVGWLGYRWWRHHPAARRLRSQAAPPTAPVIRRPSPPDRNLPG